MWQFEQVGALFQLAELGRVDADGLRRANAHGPLCPSAAEWRQVLDRVLGIGGALLLAAGLIFFFAYNWDDLHRFAKLGIAICAFSACVGAALVLAYANRGIGYQAALLGANLSTGALLALIGQTYQTGADMWMLFAAWATLMTPLVLLARSQASWALWLVVINTALGLALSRSMWFPLLGILNESASLLAIAGTNAAALSLFECVGRLLFTGGQRHVHRLAALGVFGPLTVGAIGGWWDQDFQDVLIAFLLVAGACAWVYRRLRFDLAILALTTYAAIAVGAAGLIWLLPSNAFIAWNLIAAIIIAASGWAGWWLTRLHKEHA